MDKRLKVVTAQVNEFNSSGVRLLKYYIQDAIYNGQKVLPIVIDSCGGEVYSALAMIDALKASGLKAITISTGKTFSAGTLLLSYGEKRYGTENTDLMIHEASNGAYGTATEMEAKAKQLKKVSDKMLEMMAKNINQSKDYFKILLKANDNQDLYMSATEAKDIGLLTDIGYPALADIFPEEIDLQEIESESEGEDANLKILMKYTEPNFNFLNKQEEKKEIMDLNAIKAKLDDKAKKVIEELENKPTALQIELDKAKADLQGYEQKITALEEEKNKLSEQADKDFIASAVASGKITKKDEADELEILGALSGDKKQKYKDKLLARASVIPNDEIPDFNEKKFTEGSIQAQLESIAKKLSLDLKDPSQLVKAQLELAVNGGKA